MLHRIFQMRSWRYSLISLFLIGAQSLLVVANASIATADIPMLALKAAPGLVMLTMSRDQRLFYSAYNEVTDLDGDGVLDVGYKDSIKYYGYFVSDRCYAYDSTNNRFSPKSVASTTDGCLSAPSSARWHGNWLNWMTTSRIDALRKVLYGGKRSTDTTSLTVLEAAPIPLDSHIWGKEYRPTASGGTDTYNIRHFTPLSAPDTGKQHIFLMKSSETTTTAPYIGVVVPALRVVEDVDANIDRVWLWASSERPVGGTSGATAYTRQNKSGSDKVINPTPSLISYGVPGFPNSTSGGTTYGSSSPSYEYKLTVRVEACVNLSPGGREAGCTGYPVGSSSPTIYKPTGVLHDYSVNDRLKFGLLTGSYTNNYSGGVLRKDIGSFADEYSSSTGVFSSVSGIVKTVNALTSVGLRPSDQLYLSNSVNTTTCPVGSLEWNRLRCQGEVNMWGAPVAEMMYEGLRYFTDKQPLTAFTTGVTSGTATASLDGKLGLPLVSTWSNPYRPKASGGNPICSRAVQMVIADPITSFDSDQLPGAAFTPDTGKGTAVPVTDLPGLNVSNEADAIWTSEFGTSTPKKFFIGQTTATNADGNPSSKSATSFKYLRGHAPDETNTQGSYYAASVAKFAHGTYDTDKRQLTGVKVGPTGSKVLAPVDTISVALGSVVPRFEISYGGNKVSLVPFSKSISGGSCSPAPTAAVSAPAGFQPTGLITGMFIDRIANTASTNADASINGSRPFARFMVSFSDMDVGGDNEADANVYYTVWIDSNDKLNVRMDPYDTATCTNMHMGYVISGTIGPSPSSPTDGLYLDVRSTGSTTSKYYLDTPPSAAVPAASPWGTPSAVLSNVSSLRQFTLSSSSSGATYVPHDPLWYAAKYGGANDLASAIDPTNYFKVTNASALPAQMEKAFRSAAALAAVASTSVVGVGQRSAGSAAIYQSSYDSLTWSSRLYAFKVGLAGIASNTPSWDASQLIDVPTARHLYLGRGGTTTPVALTATGTDWSSTALTSAEQANFGTYDQYKYLLGDKTYEERKAVTAHTAYRNRGTTFSNEFGSVLGDVVNSDPQIVTKKSYGYADTSYASFVNGISYETLAVNANDGFFHVFDAGLPTEPPAAPNPTAGKELFAFMPRTASVNIKELSDPAYKHRYLLDGPIAVGHAKIPVKTDASINWRSVLVGTGGLGAKTVFAVDASSKTFSADSVLWEMDVTSLGGTNGVYLGNVVGRPQIGKLANGTWVAIFGNGYNSANDTAKLFVVNLQTGALIKILDTNAGMTGNGLGGLVIVRKKSGDTDAIDYVYGADYLGNIWRFDLYPTTPTAWDSGRWIYSSSSGRNITAEISVGAPPTVFSAGAMIYFGTGRYLSASDTSDTTTVHALYGIYDAQTHSSSTTALISTDSVLISGSVNMASSSADTRSTTMPSSWWLTAGNKGWVVPLSGTNVQPGERVIAPPVRYTQVGKVDALLFTSIVPGTDECVAGLDTWITAVDPLTGASAPAFKDLTANSVKVVGGSPRGVFVLSETRSPTLYISQTVFNISAPPTSSYSTLAGGSQTVCINGVCGQTRVLGINLTPGNTIPVTPTNRRQVWRQLK